MRDDLLRRIALYVHQHEVSIVGLVKYQDGARGDIPGISCVMIDGQVRVGRSRNTALAKRLATLTGVSVAGGGH